MYKLYKLKFYKFYNFINKNFSYKKNDIYITNWYFLCMFKEFKA